jgi:hypothetical protein
MIKKVVKIADNPVIEDGGRKTGKAGRCFHPAVLCLIVPMQMASSGVCKESQNISGWNMLACAGCFYNYMIV